MAPVFLNIFCIDPTSVLKIRYRYDRFLINFFRVQVLWLEYRKHSKTQTRDFSLSFFFKLVSKHFSTEWSTDHIVGLLQGCAMPAGSGLRGVLYLPWRLPICVLPTSQPSWHQGSRCPCSFGWRSRMNSLMPRWVFLSREHTASPLGPCRGVACSILYDDISAAKRRPHFRTQRHTPHLPVGRDSFGSWRKECALWRRQLPAPPDLLRTFLPPLSPGFPGLRATAPECLQHSLISFCVFLSL